MFGFFDGFPALIFMFLGSLGVFVFSYDFFLLNKTKWKGVVGKVKRSEVEESFNKLHEGLGSAWSYYPKVEYEFDVDGIHFLGGRINVGSNIKSNNKLEVHALIKKYPVDSILTIYYDANDPEVSCLEKKIHGSSYFFLLLGLGFVSVGCLIY